ncbi:MAG: AarF/UbiB family protein, partial [Planctomycetota bacterium]
MTMTPFQITRSVRGLNRLRHIARVLTQHGFGHVVSQLNLSRYVPVWMMRRKAKVVDAASGSPSIGRRIARICSELGPTFVKLGQMLSTRPDLVPVDVLKELRTLQDNVPPFDTQSAMQILQSELGRPIRECYSSVDEVPIASGSIGQVYRACTVNGGEVVIKIRRPDADDTIRSDIVVLKWLAESLEALVPESRMYRPKMLIAELEEMLTRELDYVHEASATTRFAAAFSNEVGLKIPAVFWDLSGKRILTLGVLRGVNFAEIWGGDKRLVESIDRKLLARRLANAYFKQVFEIGLFHCDPHPGNLLVEPPATLGLLDFGQVTSVSNELMTELVAIVYACVHREVSLVVDGLADLGALGENTDRRGLERSLGVLIDKYHGLPLKLLELTTIIAEFSDVIRRHDVIIPRDAVLLCKGIGMVAGLCAKLDPDLDVLSLLRERLEKTTRSQFSTQAFARGAAISGWHVYNILRRAPAQLRESLRRAGSG